MCENTMMANNVRSLVNIPTFNRENMHIYINKLKMWQFVTGVEKKKQGPLVWMSLPINDSSNIKQAINDIIGMDDLIKEDGMDRIINLLKKTSLGVVVEEVGGIHNEVDSRQEGIEDGEEEQDEDDLVMLLLAEVGDGVVFEDVEGVHSELRREEMEDDEEEQDEDDLVMSIKMEQEGMEEEFCVDEGLKKVVEEITAFNEELIDL